VPFFAFASLLIQMVANNVMANVNVLQVHHFPVAHVLTGEGEADKSGGATYTAYANVFVMGFLNPAHQGSLIQHFMVFDVQARL
jgi:hypothetical protein